MSPPSSTPGSPSSGSLVTSNNRSADKDTYFQMLNLAPSHTATEAVQHTPKGCTKKPVYSVIVIDDDALSLRPKRRFYICGGDTGTDQLQVLGSLRRLLSIPLSSPLGRRLVQYIETNLSMGGSSLNPCTVAHTLFGSGGTPEYGAFCRTPVKISPNVRLRHREFPVRFRQNVVGYCHRYSFGRNDRQKFCMQYDTGLNLRSRSLQKRYSNCCVSLFRLKSEEIADWRTSKRLREIVEKPSRVIFVDLVDTDESPAGSESEQHEAEPAGNLVSASSSGSSVQFEHPALASGIVKPPCHKTVPNILKRVQGAKTVDSSPSKSSVITLSSDSEDDSSNTLRQKRFIFHCHKCSAEIACGAQFPDLVKSHYRDSHNICNIDLLCQRQPNGETTLSVVQLPTSVSGGTGSSFTSPQSMPSSAALTQLTEAATSLQLLPVPVVSQLVTLNQNGNNCTSQSAITSVFGIAHRPHTSVVTLMPRVPLNLTFMPQRYVISTDRQSTLKATDLLSTCAPVASVLLDASRRLVADNASAAAAAGLNNCSRSLMSHVNASASAVCEPDVICLD